MRHGLLCLGLFSALVLASCGGGGSGGDKAGDVTLKASSAEQALSWLPAKERQGFDAWKTRLAKSCTVDDLFDGQADAPAVDSALFQGLIGPASVLTGDAGEFAVVGQGTPLAGLQLTERKNSVTENGRIVSGLEANTKREGSHCVVNVFGQKVAEVQLFESVPVLAHYQIHKAKDGTNVEVAVPPQPLSKGAYRGVDVTAYLQPVLKALAPNATSREFVAKRLSLPAASAARLVRIATTQFDATVWSVSVADSPALSPRFPLWMGSEAVLAAQTGGEQEFEWAIDAHGAAAARLRVAVAYAPTAVAGRGKASLRSLSLGAPLARSPERAGECFARRLSVARALKYTPPRLAEPSVAEAAGPCRVFSPSFAAMIAGSPEARRAFVNTFAELPPSKAILYGDWDAALFHVAGALHRDGKDFAAVLNPEGNSTVLQEASKSFRPFAAGLKGTEADVLATDLLTASLHWALRGDAPSQRTQENLLAAVKKAGAVLPESTKALIAAISHAPHAQDAVLDYAIGLSPELVDSIRIARQKMAALGLQSWGAEKFSRALQTRLEPIVVRSWIATLEPAAAFAEGEKARKPGFSHEGNRTQVLRMALEEGWDASTFALFEKIVSSAPRKTSCTSQTDLSSIATCVGLSTFSRKEKGMLFADYGNRYGDAATQFAAQLVKIEKASSMLKYNVGSTFWEPVWKRCSNGDFARKAGEANRAIEGLVNERENFKKYDWERKIRDAWRDC